MNDLHHPCEHWAERISLAAAGCLSADEEREVRRHIETCSDCRERFRQLTELCSALAEAQLPAVGTEAAIVQQVMSAITSGDSERPVVRTPAEMIHPTLLTRSLNTWRCIMRHPVSLTTAAAIFLLAVIGVALWFHGGGTTPAFADFIAPILHPKTVKYKVTTKWTSLSAEMKSQLSAETQKYFLEGSTSEVMMLDANRSRTVLEGPDEFKSVQIWDGGQGKQLCLIPAKKQAQVFNSANKSKDKTPNGGDPVAGWRSLLLDARDKPNVKRESLGEKDIDGRRVVGFRISSPEAVFSVWGDPKTGLPARIEMTTKIMPNIELTISDFEFNVDMDESLFSVEPPAGYEVGSFFISTPTIDGSKTKEQDLIETFREYSRLSGGPFPALLNAEAITGIIYMEFTQDRMQEPGAEQELAQTQAKLQPGLMFSVLLPKEADSHYAGKGVSLGAADTPIFWYRPKDAKQYRVIYADLSVRDAATPPVMPVATAAQLEKDLIETFRCYSELSGGPFPAKLDLMSLLQGAAMKIYMPPEDGQKLSAKQMQEITKTARLKFQPGLTFVTSLPPEADAHYAGKGVSLGAADTPIFWYRPKDAKTYRVIYADLSARDADTPPSVPAVQPEQDLIDTFREYCELSDGPFPPKLDLMSLLQTASMKFYIKFPPEDGQKPSAKHMQGVSKSSMKFQPGLDFTASLPPKADAHYAGKGVSLGATDTPIFWYRPKEAKKYRVIYADLSVHEADTPPNVPDAQPVPAQSSPKK